MPEVSKCSVSSRFGKMLIGLLPILKIFEVVLENDLKPLNSPSKVTNVLFHVGPKRKYSVNQILVRSHRV